MARTLFDCIGDWFENVLQSEFRDLTKTENCNGTRPDFSGASFDAEAKVGYWDYGAQLKESQISQFEENGKPLIYIIGFHNLYGLKDSTKNMNAQQIDAFLKRNVGLHSAYAVSNEIIKKIWRKENHAAAQDPDWRYFSIRPRHLETIIQNRPLVRKGVRYMPSNRYKIVRPSLLLQSAPLLSGKTKDLKFGTILDKKADELAIQYLKENRLIN